MFEIYRVNVICWSSNEKDRQAIFIMESSMQQYVEETIRNFSGERFLMTMEVADVPQYDLRKVRDWLLFGANPDILNDLQWEVLNVINEGEDDTMLKLKNENFNPWEFNIPVSELVGYIYVADDEDGDLILMSEVELSDGRTIDVQIIGISNDLGTVTVSTGTNFMWGAHVCTSHESLRSAYLHFITGKVHD